MPEEINRIVTDTLSDLLFTHSPEAREHLTREGVPENRIHFVGNVMIDCLIQHQERIDRSGALDELHLQPGEYALLTLHRPSNVDAYEPLKSIADALGHLGNRLKIVFSIHPRTRKMLDQFGLTEALSGVSSLIHLEPQPYFDFLKLQKHARLVLTDSGGVQEETTFLGVPCLTLRENTERPVTLTEGTSRLVGSRTEAIIAGIDQALAGQWPAGKIPEYWDGQASGRIVHILSALV